jgi:hypothetical protein
LSCCNISLGARLELDFSLQDALKKGPSKQSTAFSVIDGARRQDLSLLGHHFAIDLENALLQSSLLWYVLKPAL